MDQWKSDTYVQEMRINWRQKKNTKIFIGIKIGYF